MMNEVRIYDTKGNVISSKKTTSNNFKIRNLPFGQCDVLIRKKGFKPFRKTLNVKDESQQLTAKVLKSPFFQLDNSLTPPIFKKKLNQFDGVTTYDLVKDFGAVGDGITNNFTAIKNAIRASITEPIVITVPEGEYYSKGETNDRIQMYPDLSKGIKLIGYGNAIFLPENNRTSDKHDHWWLQLDFSTDNIGFEMDNIIVDGIKNPQDLNRTMPGRQLAGDVPLQRGIEIRGAKEISIHDSTFKNLYGGYAVFTRNVLDGQVNVIDCNFERVGGNNWTESYGICLYFSGSKGVTYYNIDNCHAYAHTDPLDKGWMGWIGVVLENGSIQSENKDNWILDTNTVVTITNSTFKDYETLYHMESQAGNVYWNSYNVKTRCKNYMVAAGVVGEIIEKNYLMEIDLLDYPRGWSELYQRNEWGINNGLYNTEKEERKNINGQNQFLMYSATVNYLDENPNRNHSYGISRADDCSPILYDTTLNGVNGRLVVNSGAELHNVAINKAQGLTYKTTTDFASFSTATQSLDFLDGTTVNEFGSWKTIQVQPEPPRAEPTGYVAPELTVPMGPAYTGK